MRPHHDRPHHVPLLDRRAGGRHLYRRHDHVADVGRVRVALQHFDAEQLPGAGVIGDSQASVRLDHCWLLRDA